MSIVSNFISDKLKNLINDLRQELEKTKNEKVELLSSLNEERKISEDLKLGLESLPGVKAQISEQEQLIAGKYLFNDCTTHLVMSISDEMQRRRS